MLALLVCLAQLNKSSYFYCYLFDRQKFYIPKTFEYIDDFYAVKPDHQSNDFDYVIIGSGTAGSIVASQLAKRQNKRILVIEAGDNANGNILNEVPGLAPLTWSNSYGDFVWDHSTANQSFLFNRSLKLPSGKLLGGSSTINFMIFGEPLPNDYNRWKNVTGCEKWDWALVKKYFHGIESGSVTKTQSTRLGTIWTEAWGEISRPEIFHDKEQRMFIKDGLRWNMAKHALYEASKKQNVVVLKNNVVNKIIFNSMKTTKTATSVSITNKNGQTQYISVKKKVILSAGPIQNVKILRNSIGSSNHQAIGKNFKDHLFVPVFFQIDEKQVYGYSSSLLAMLLSLIDYIFGLKGPLAQTIVDGGQAYLKTEALGINSEFHEFNPDLQFVLLSNLFDTLSLDKIFSHFFDWDSFEIFKRIFSRPLLSSKNGFIVFVALTQPHSVGRVTFNQSFDINPNYLSDPRDLRRILIGIKQALDLVFKTKAFARLNKSLIKPLGEELDPMDECLNDLKNADLNDVDGGFNVTYWSCYIKKLSFSYFHYCGTVSFGQEADNTVLDCDLKVRNTDNLYVVDSSVMPYTVSGGLQGLLFYLIESFIMILYLNS